jgi:glycosyltransferase involved in cell wall biosynthesis
MGRISVVINTLNEEENLLKALSSIKKLADEIVVVDMHSTDNTVKIAKKAGAKVFKHKRTGYVEPARNFAIKKATGDWILMLDADEEVSLSLSVSLGKIIKRPKADYYRLPRKNIIFGKWIKHSRWWPDYNIRFFKKGYVDWSEIIHSVPLTKGKGLDLEAKEGNAITHYHYKSIDQYIDRMNNYSARYAKMRFEEGYKFRWHDLIKRPSDEFLSRYFFGKGYRDGIHGLALSGLQAFFEFVIYLKIWQLNKFKEKDISISEIIKKMKVSESDLHYWHEDTLLKEVGGLKHRVKRKLKI